MNTMILNRGMNSGKCDTIIKNIDVMAYIDVSLHLTCVLVTQWIQTVYIFVDRQIQIYVYKGEQQKATDKVKLWMTTAQVQEAREKYPLRITKYLQTSLAHQAPDRQIIGDEDSTRGNPTLCSSCSCSFPRCLLWPMLEMR